MIRKLLQRHEQLSSVVPLDYSHISSAGVRVSESAALGVTGVWRATNLIANAIATLPLHGYADRDRMDPTPELLAQPNPSEDRVDTIFGIVTSLLLHGNAYAVKGEGFIVPVHPNDVAEDVRDGRRIININGVPFSPSEVLHIPAFKMPGSAVGLGVIQAQMQALGYSIALTRYSQRWFGESSIPSGVVSIPQPITPDEATEIKRQWIQAHAESRSPAVLHSGASFTPVLISPEISQFVESRQLSLTEIAIMFGLQPYWLGAPGASMTYSNVESEGLNLLRWALTPWIVRIERAFSNLLPEGHYAKFNTDSILRADTLTRLQAHEKALALGIYDLDRAKEIEDE